MTKFKAFRLRMSLLRIWFIKNLVVFLELMIFISLILILTGNIDQNTPVLGIIFGDLSVAINDILAQRYSDDIIINLLTILLSLLVTIGTLSTNLKRIALSDIKNPELKKMLIRAGLYFNKDGKLVKKVETASRIDLDGDGKIGDTELTEIPREKFIPSLKRSMEELGTILTVKIETEAELDQIKQDTDLKATEAAVKEVLPQAFESAQEVTADQLVSDLGQVEPEETRNIVKAGLSAVGTGIVTAAVFVKDVTVKGAVGAGKGIKVAAIATGGFFKNIGLAIAGFFKKIFTKKEKAEKPIKLKEAKPAKVKKEKQPKTVVQAPIVQPQVQQQTQAPVDPLQALRQKYGK